ncbi:MAG: putative DNA binding domain-containing protein [Prevotellaceae bacterium]|nr:putative DNA binding domain-containing protein [Prevotellaceae bacterium]
MGKETGEVEFKSSFGKEVIESVVAFSNYKGGRIVIGCNNQGEITGVTISDESIPTWINEIKQNTQPAVFPDFEHQMIEDKTIVIVKVDEFPLKPVAFKDRYFVRRANSNHLLTIDEIAEMRFISLSYSFDSFEVDTKYEDLDQTALSLFYKRLKETGRYVSSGDLQDDFEKLGLINNGKVTRATQLLFGRHRTGIHLGRFKARDTIIDDVVIRSPLYLAVEEAMIFIKKHISLAYEFTGELRRKERWQYPLQAIRESLLNAVIHKDYTNHTDVIIKIFDDSIEITNPGHLMTGLTLSDLQTNNYKPLHRNKLLVEAFYLTGDIEKYGTGFIRLRKWLKEYPKVTYNFTDWGGVMEMEYRVADEVPDDDKTPNEVSDEVPDRVPDEVSDEDKCPEKVPDEVPDIVPDEDKVPDNLTANQKSILNFMLQNKRISMSELSVKIGISKRKILDNINKLRDKNLLKREGNNKSGHWQVNVTMYSL